MLAVTPLVVASEEVLPPLVAGVVVGEFVIVLISDGSKLTVCDLSLMFIAIGCC